MPQIRVCHFIFNICICLCVNTFIYLYTYLYLRVGKSILKIFCFVMAHSIDFWYCRRHMFLVDFVVFTVCRSCACTPVVLLFGYHCVLYLEKIVYFSLSVLRQPVRPILSSNEFTFFISKFFFFFSNFSFIFFFFAFCMVNGK